MSRGVLFAAATLAAAFLLRTPISAEYEANAEIQKGLEALKEARYVAAREIAERVLKANPESFEGWYLLGSVYLRGDTNLPRARYCLTKARDLIEKRWTPPISNAGPEDFHHRIMDQLVALAGLTEEREWQIQLIHEHDRLYTPALQYRIGWPLMKLGRFEEARAAMLALVDSKDEDEQTDALNTLGAIAAEQDRREEAYEWFTRLSNLVDERKWTTGIEFIINRASAAQGLLRFNEAEHELLRASRQDGRGTSANPWMDLALLYAGSGRLAEAISASKRMHEFSLSTDPVLWEQKWNANHQATATVLLAAGYDEEALSILRTILNRPDRLGTTSVHAHEAEVGLLQLYREALKTRQQRLREEMSWCGATDWIKNAWEWLSIEREMWSARNRAAALIMQHNQLAWTMIPYGPDTTTVEWMRSSMREIVGTGLWENELHKLLTRTGAEADREKPYLLAELGESEWSRGDYQAALSHLNAAEQGLPSEEVLLRARLNAVIGSAKQKLGDNAASNERYRRALDSDPRVFRMLDIPLPVTITSDNDAESQRVATMLRNSPRFSRGNAFFVRVSHSGRLLTGRLEAADGTVFCDVAVPVRGDEKESARAFSRELHRRSFGVKIDLSQMDIQSIDGSNQVADSDSETLRELFTK